MGMEFLKEEKTFLGIVSISHIYLSKERQRQIPNDVQWLVGDLRIWNGRPLIKDLKTLYFEVRELDWQKDDLNDRDLGCPILRIIEFLI